MRAHAPRIRFLPVLFALPGLLCATPSETRSQGMESPEVSGELRRWHPVTLSFVGPHVDEADSTNPFRDFRLQVTFRHPASRGEVVVPGYFAADGAAAETGATGGDRWRVHFTPPEVGEWLFTASFRTGTDVAMELDPVAGAGTGFDGASGRLRVAETDAAGRDFRARGMLRYVGERYLRFDSGEWFLKGGADSPETLLAYVDFDGTASLAPPGVARQGEAVTAGLKQYEPHLRDWRPGDPDWRGERGRGLIGALNYLAAKGMNAISFLTMNVEGDGGNVWPWTAPDQRDRYDVSKLAQWERVFAHADSIGLHLHFKTQETENDLLLDGGELGPERKLYYRELVARFGHHLALNWNLGEENDIGEELEDPEQTRIRAYTRYLRDLDPYDHPIVIHTYPDRQAEVYEPLLGDRSELTGVSLQTHFDRVYPDTRRWLEASRRAGKPWVVANDEQGPAGVGVMPDGEGNNHAEIRRHTLWGNLMAGGAGVEYYFGYQFPHNDLNAEDLRSRDRMWDQTRHALTFFREHLPFPEMEAQDGLSDPRNYVFAAPGEIYAVYVPGGAETRLELPATGSFRVEWFDPRGGGELRAGSVEGVRGGGSVSIGAPPEAPEEDWVALIRRAR